MILVWSVWRILLPAHHWPREGFDSWFSAAEDFGVAGAVMGSLCFIAGVIVIVGGLIQLLKHSRRAGMWSITFGGVALIIGIFLASYAFSIVPPIDDILRVPIVA
jgi:Ca2+/Na+ antiporter